MAVSLGHTLKPPVPSLFTFTRPGRHGCGDWPESPCRQWRPRFPGQGCASKALLLITHCGLSGPAILRLSAWGARELHERDYRFPLHVNWLPHFEPEALAAELTVAARRAAARYRGEHAPGAADRPPVGTTGPGGGHSAPRPAGPICPAPRRHQLVQQLTAHGIAVSGKSLNKEEFVTCGGVRLGEVNFKTMESRLCPGLYFAGELLDIDGITGGFNFQAAWTTGWIAGRAMAGAGASAFTAVSR